MRWASDTVTKTPARKRIAVVIPKYGLPGGAEGFAAALTERLARNPRYECHVFANRWREEVPGITFHRVLPLGFPKSLVTPGFAFFARRAMSRLPFDIVHTHERIFGADLFTMHGIPHRAWVRDVRCKRMSLADRSTDLVERRLAKRSRCRRFLAVSGLVKEIFLQEYPMDPERVPVIHPGVSAMGISPAGRVQARREERESRRIPPDAAVCLFVSMNYEIKGLDLVIEGLGRLECRSGTPFYLIVAGKGNEGKYLRMAEASGIAGRLRFAGVLDRRGMERIYAAGDVFVMPSRFDTFGMVVLEAMASGLPVVVSRHVGARDLVRPGKNGFIVDRDDAEGLACILDGLRAEEIRSRMAHEARETARHHTWESAASRVSALYEEVLTGRTS